MTIAKPSVRTRFTLMYGAMLLLTNVGALGTLYLLMRGTSAAKSREVYTLSTRPGGESLVDGVRVPLDQAAQAAAQARTDTLHHLIEVSAGTVAVLAVLGLLTGWWMAGRVLRPLQVITAMARDLSSTTLDQRIALGGPDDELKNLADTFDDMLVRLERSFESQRRFVANASHELRTPVAIERAAIEIGLSAAGPEDIPRIRGELLAANRRTEYLINGLLLLAESDRGLTERCEIRLHELVADVVADYRDRATTARVTVRSRLDHVAVCGEPVLLTQAVGNLLQNALRYNVAGGSIDVTLDAVGVLVVSNSGPQVPPEAVPELFEPFRRLEGRTGGPADGAGLGLSIVRSIVQAHDGRVGAHSRPDGGLDVRVELPALTPHLAASALNHGPVASAEGSCPAQLPFRPWA
jgi:signal transduction histidine kinase